MPELETGIKSDLLHVVLSDVPYSPDDIDRKYNLEEFTELLSNLAAFFAYADYLDKMYGWLPGITTSKSALGQIEYVMVAVKKRTRFIRIARIHYESPADLLFYVASGGAGTGTLWSALRLYSYLLDLVEKTSATNLTLTKHEIIRSKMLEIVKLDDPKAKQRGLLKKLLKTNDSRLQLLAIIESASVGVTKIEKMEKVERQHID